MFSYQGGKGVQHSQLVINYQLMKRGPHDLTTWSTQDMERRSIYIYIALSLCYKQLPTRAIAVTGPQKRTQSTCILHRLHHVRAALKQEAERFPMPHADRIIVTTTDGDHTSEEVIVGLIRTHIGGIYNV